MRYNVLPWAATLFLALTTLVTLLVESSTISSGSCIVTVYPDGGVFLEYKLVVRDAPANVTLRVPRNAIYISVYDGGNPAPYSYDEASGLLSLITFSGDVSVRAYTLDLTLKEGAIWRLQLGDVDLETLVELPREALVISIEPRDFNVRLINNTLYLVFNPGSYVRIEYMIVPVTTPPPTTPPLRETRVGEEVTPPKTEGVGLYLTLLLIAGALIGLPVAGVLLLRYRRVRSSSSEVTVAEEGLDERDKLILETLKNMGEATASALQKTTGIPKTPLYRKLEKLERIGFVESEWRGGVKVYRVKK